MTGVQTCALPISNFSLWPEDEKIRLAESALPLDTVDPACKVFKDNPVFTRK